MKCLDAHRAENIERAALALQGGGLVAFPTETVYGLGGHAWDGASVARVFEVKARPLSNPLSILVPSVEHARALVAHWPHEAERLATRFWPGPLTMVLPKHPDVPEILTAGGDTVGVRIPDHPVALALLEACGLPLATSSANPSGMEPPTTSDAVKQAFAGRSDGIAMLLEGGETSVKVASTVVGLADGGLLIYREGSLSRERLNDALSDLRQK